MIETLVLFLGYGIGSFFSGIFRAVIPLLRSGGYSLGREIIKGASGLLENMENKQSAVKAGAKAVINNLKNTDVVAKLKGDGYKRGTGRKRRVQSRRGKGANKTSKRRTRKKKSVKAKSAAGRKKKSIKRTKRSTKLARLRALAKARLAKKSKAPDFFN